MTHTPPAMPALPRRSASGFKHTFGTVVVVAGSRTMIGAPCCVAQGALRSGCGLVRLAVDDDILIACLTLVPSAIGLSIGTADAADLIAQLDHRSIIAAGPGLGLDLRHGRILSDLLAGPQALVVDGDGLTHLAHLSASAMQRPQPLVLTPHPGEYERFARPWGLPLLSSHATDYERTDAAARLAQETGAVVVLKGHRTVVAMGDTTWTCSTGNAVLAIPGSGDVLTGVISGLMAQGLPAFDAARLGVHLHGLAGDHWAKQHPSGLVAMDLADLIPVIAQGYAQGHRGHPAI